MEETLIEKIAKMLTSEDKEMVELAELLLTGLEPVEYEDYIKFNKLIGLCPIF